MTHRMTVPCSDPTTLMLQCNRGAPEGDRQEAAAALRDLSPAYLRGDRGTIDAANTWQPRPLCGLASTAIRAARDCAMTQAKSPGSVRGSCVSRLCRRSVDARLRKIAQYLRANARVCIGSDPSPNRRYAVVSGENWGPLRVIVMHGRLGQRRRYQHHRCREGRQHHLQGYHLQPLSTVLHRLGDSGNRSPGKPSKARKKASKISSLYGFNVDPRNSLRAFWRTQTASFSRCTTNRINKVLTTIVAA
jgi:hypothetical protein